MTAPSSDEDVSAWWQALGLPGLFDVHVHFLPPRIEAAVWRQFDDAGPKIGRPWPICCPSGGAAAVPRRTA